MRTLRVCSARASSPLARRFQRALVCMLRTKVMHVVCFVEIVLQFQSVTEPRWGVSDGEAHAPEGRDPRCRRRARSLAPCATVGNRTRCTCVAEPLGSLRKCRRSDSSAGQIASRVHVLRAGMAATAEHPCHRHVILAEGP